MWKLPSSRSSRWNSLSVAGLLLLSGATGSGGCFPQALSFEELRAALEESVMQGEGIAIENGILEITTAFTVGEAVSDIVEEVQAFADSQVPCATVEKLDARTISVDFGELGDQCEFRGRTYAGVLEVSYAVNSNSVVVTHVYSGLTNGSATVDGEAVVTWTADTRRVETDLQVEGRRGEAQATSDRTQQFIDPELGLDGGIRIDGERRWTAASGTWILEIDGVEWRGVDPVPQAGTYVIENPEEKSLELSFDRVDEDTIAVTARTGFRERTFHVTSTGTISDEG